MSRHTHTHTGAPGANQVARAQRGIFPAWTIRIPVGILACTSTQHAAFLGVRLPCLAQSFVRPALFAQAKKQNLLVCIRQGSGDCTEVGPTLGATISKGDDHHAGPPRASPVPHRPARHNHKPIQGRGVRSCRPSQRLETPRRADTNQRVDPCASDYHTNTWPCGQRHASHNGRAKGEWQARRTAVAQRAPAEKPSIMDGPIDGATRRHWHSLRHNRCRWRHKIALRSPSRPGQGFPRRVQTAACEINIS